MTEKKNLKLTRKERQNDTKKQISILNKRRKRAMCLSWIKFSEEKKPVKTVGPNLCTKKATTVTTVPNAEPLNDLYFSNSLSILKSSSSGLSFTSSS